MTTNIITRSKYVVEVVSISVDFTDMLPSGTSIEGVPTVSVSVFSGYDNNPSSILYLGVSVEGNVVSQRIKEGVIGCIYRIQVTASDGIQSFVKETYLAILPTEGEVVPNLGHVLLTSDLYPLQEDDSFSVSFTVENGTWNIGQTWMQDPLSVSMSPLDGTFTPGQTFYTGPSVDFFNTTMQPGDGTFTVGQVFYSLPPNDFFSTAFSPLNGTFVEGQVFYTMQSETMSVSFTPEDGTFTNG